jgi:hypothetical protein
MKTTIAIVCSLFLLSTARAEENWSVVINLKTKDVKTTNTVSIRELVPVLLQNIGSASPTNLVVRLTDNAKTVMALATNFAASGTNAAAGTMDMNTTELVALFSNRPPQGVAVLTIGVWDTARQRLLVNDKIPVQNNPYEDGMAGPSPAGTRYLVGSWSAWTGGLWQAGYMVQTTGTSNEYERVLPDDLVATSTQLQWGALVGSIAWQTDLVSYVVDAAAAVSNFAAAGILGSWATASNALAIAVSPTDATAHAHALGSWATASNALAIAVSPTDATARAHALGSWATASNALPLSGGTVSGDIDLGVNDLSNVSRVMGNFVFNLQDGHVTGGPMNFDARPNVLGTNVMLEGDVAGTAVDATARAHALGAWATASNAFDIASSPTDATARAHALGAWATASNALAVAGGTVAGDLAVLNIKVGYENEGAVTGGNWEYFDQFTLGTTFGVAKWVNNNLWYTHADFDGGASNKFWSSYNDASGSGLDADLLDGQHGTNFATAVSNAASYALAQVAAAHALGAWATASNALELSGGTISGTLTLTNSTGVIAFGTNNNEYNYIGFSPALDGGAAAFILANNITNSFMLYTATNGAASWGGSVARGDLDGNLYTLWDIANDGSGSGMNSDLLDGNDSSYFRNAASLTNVGAMAGINAGAATNFPSTLLTVSAAQTNYWRMTATAPTGSTAAGLSHQINVSAINDTSVWVSIFWGQSNRWYRAQFNGF